MCCIIKSDECRRSNQAGKRLVYIATLIQWVNLTNSSTESKEIIVYCNQNGIGNKQRNNNKIMFLQRAEDNFKAPL